jgi:5-methylcytosine-specific restriction enzyme subunit McrC
MSDFQQQYDLWDEFLKTWPASRLAAMTLDEYTQAGSGFSLVRHQSQDWFRLKPDLLIRESAANRLVLDTKWKLIDGAKANGTDKYGLSQGDFYQLHAYGQNYLDGQGDVVLIYPKTDAFYQALPVFEFPKSKSLRLWVLPFCLQWRQIILPACGSLDGFVRKTSPLAERNVATNTDPQ